MPYWVYLLKCYKRRRFTNFYTGQTNDISARLSEHIENVIYRDTERYTGRFDYVRLAWKQKCRTRSEARRLEKEIKQLTQNEKWALVKGRKFYWKGRSWFKFW
ncbi:MAG: GIY-YIG nuclease family protein [Candidatus Aenigmarchaeota archaeon]|nr:GIY-YIG nuclease family protein [Candidatus Aenigmarchaeota archaeon]NIP40710.1 GIY-YIG nuclease family protein [Candidatus Aenigmarchaeota archaeon]NIQ18516.1 GIY-YIG nuclease family protein [Candidatus Aenigmarchaeota archaeon]NIS73415.1 GIY-YIG nuclease family protein [Candidatus Aenigmarchaeota archaeon]